MEDLSLQYLSNAAPDIISMILCSIPFRNRCICALVCKAWAEAAVEATHSILRDRMQDLSGLQVWLDKHGHKIEVLQLHECRDPAVLTALPCAKLQGLLLHGVHGNSVFIAHGLWRDIAAATKLTSVSLSNVLTTLQQADVVAALTALPNLQQLTWRHVHCGDQQRLSDSSLLQQMTQLTLLDLQGVAAGALQHLSSLAKLQHLSIDRAEGWPAAGCPGLQELKAITSLQLSSRDLLDLPSSVSQLTALRQLDVLAATPTALNRLQLLTGLTGLSVDFLRCHESVPLQLTGLQRLELRTLQGYPYPMSLVASCTQLHSPKLQGFNFAGPSSLVASSMLQHLELRRCCVTAADAIERHISWQQAFPAPVQFPHLTSLQLWRKLWCEEPALQQADIDGVVESSPGLNEFGLDRLRSSCVPALAQLPGLTSLCLHSVSDEECSAFAQLTGLRKLTVHRPGGLSAVGLRQLAALNQLTSLGFDSGSFRGNQLDTLVKHWMKDTLAQCTYTIVNKVCVMCNVCSLVVRRFQLQEAL